MGTDTDISVTDGIAQIALNAGPSARLNSQVLTDLNTALDQLTKDEAVDLIVIRGKGAVFPSGVTDPQGGGDDKTNLLAKVCRAIEACPKPTVTVLTGPVVGAGAEIALASHYRLMHRQTRIGFPHARLGLVPRAGATQRLPRLIGAEATLDLLIGGALTPIATGKYPALADELFDDTPDDVITRFVANLHANGATPRPTADIRTGFVDAKAYQTALTRVRADIATSPEIAPKKILAAVEAAILLPIDAGLAFEEAAAEDCADTEQSKALSHLFHAEQLVSAQIRRNDLPEITTIGVLGGSATARQIVLVALEAGIGVSWLIKDPNQQHDSLTYVRAVLQHSAQVGRLSQESATWARQNLRSADNANILSDVDIVLRATRGQRGVAIPEDTPVAHCMPGSDPRLAMQFVAPASTSRLVEVILGPQATEKDRRIGLALARRLNKLALVETAPETGLYDNLTQTLWRAADALVDLGQSPFTIDAAMREWGMAHPPFELADSHGLDTVSRHTRADGCQNWSALLVQYGQQGRANGQGFYCYPPDSAPQEDHDILHRINERRAPQSNMPADHIRRCLIGAMANSGAKALRKNVVARAGDIDVLSVFSQLVPNWRGGVMHAAGEGGLLKTTRAMQTIDHPDQALWTPDPVFADLIKYGRRFDDL